MDEQQKLKQTFNDANISEQDKKNALNKFNSDYDKEFLKQFTEKNNKVEDILNKNNGKKYPSISKSELPEGLTLSDYKALSFVTK
jgi:vacuolar-type H+-ATPase subunit B/Vma2